ncbi:MAG: AAA family ATPase [Candidatus Saganbacteria bacterium]|nr:AAA family ATPase [Candidatus Saganbacteria bacterium]
MIKNVIKIKNFPSFVDFKPSADLPEFARYNLIYGWNGSGKTSFSRILRSFELENIMPDDPTKPPEFQFTLDNGAIIDQGDLSAYKQIRVFNEDFIDDCVFCESGPKLIFFLGKESKEDKEKILKIEEDLILLRKDLGTKELLSNKAKDNKEKSLSGKAKEIKTALTTSINDKYRNYQRPNLEDAIRNNSEKLKDLNNLKLTEDRLTALKKAILQISKAKVSIIAVPNFDTTDLEQEIEEIVKRAVVSKVIDKLRADEAMSQWVETGLELHKEKALTDCAFCNQKIPESRLVELNNHFNDEYQKTLRSVQELKGKCVSLKKSISIPDSSSFYDDLVEEYLLESKKVIENIEKYNKNIEHFVSILEQKERNLFSTPALSKLEKVDIDSITNVNNIILKHNQRSDNFENQIVQDKESLEINYIAEFWPTYENMIAECNSLEKDHSDAKGVVSGKEEELEDLKTHLISHHIPANKINKDLEQFLGRGDIQVKATDTQEGYQIVRNGVIAKNLSEGEQNALAIVYFLSKINEANFDLKNSVVVIDDPVSSLDSSAIFQAFSFIKESIKEAGQIFILTHNFDYFRQVKKWFSFFKKAEREYFMMACCTESDIRKSRIEKIDKLLIDYESEYHFLFSILFNYAEKKQRDLKDMYPIPNVARKFLESFLAFRIPNKDSIHEKLNRINYDPVKKTRINTFIQTHSHARLESGMQDFDMTILGETPDIITDLLDLVRTEDQKHYDLLVASITVAN